MIYAGGVQANFFYAVETNGNPFNPGDWNWSSANTYIGMATGALTALNAMGVSTTPAFLSNLDKIDGMITRGIYQAGVNVVSNGSINSVSGRTFFDGWEGAALSGFVLGAVKGYNLAQENGTNYWWGTKIAHNRSQYSIAWWNKNDFVKFDVKKYGVGEIEDGCVYGSMEMVTGVDEHEWQKRLGDNVKTSNVVNKLTNAGVEVDFPNIYDYETMSYFQEDGGKLILTLNSYQSTPESIPVTHALAVKKITYTSNGRYRIKVYNPDPSGVKVIQGEPHQFNKQYNGFNYFGIYW